MLGLKAAAKERAEECFQLPGFSSNPDPDSLLNSPSATPQHCEQTWTHRLDRNDSKLFPHLQSRKIFPLKEVIPDHESSLVFRVTKVKAALQGKGIQEVGWW